MILDRKIFECISSVGRMDIPNPKIEARILGWLVSNRNFEGNVTVSANSVIEICTPTLLKEQDVTDSKELETLLFDMEVRGLLERRYETYFALSNQGFLQFKLSLAPLEDMRGDIKKLEKLVETSSASNEVKKEVKNALKDFAKRTGTPAIEYLLNFIARNPQYIDEIFRVLEKITKTE